MTKDHWQWQPGKVDLSNRYFELKYGYLSRPVARIGISDYKTFIVEFLLNINDDIELLKKIFAEVLEEIELYLINNNHSDPVKYMIDHTKKCSNAYGKIRWYYFPKGANKSIFLSKESLFFDKVFSIKKLFSKK
ncbi:MAG TPA: hypothetical protein PK073_07960 [Ignavibacteriaceae bacterium]|jgi:hypothetical protein|nr:MAG: hypothetical protein BWY38_01953 [Ignavibacteria bacterium ADurb.Bin266]OQY70592.1 MAG: hypothetical protein B6D44_15490 [Ignavibacteriales bacterium UTCHB2]HQF42836.1 hypothetical protein [Ignavibacteriaceae bacterium]HQI42192.1 hypothetical protein [Ignavibacteriaceae bacterium]HQJ45310.1 hypothetical protein [Ignavibacteriaceae bacterium]